MKNKKIVIGGEKVFSIQKLLSSKENGIFSTYKSTFKSYHIHYTLGGHYSLLAIVEDLHKSGQKGKLLVPSYICKSILITLNLKKVSYDFYKVTSNLTIDIEDIKKKCESSPVSAMIIIDYMGKSQFDAVDVDFIADLKSREIKIIQDCVHSLCLDDYKIYGDYAYNSFRKILPFEGSLLISKDPMEIDFATGTNYKFIFYKRCGQIFRSWYIKFNLFGPKHFLDCFCKAEESYNVNKIFKLSKFQKWLISKIDLTKLYYTSKIYYKYMLDKFKDSTIPLFQDNSYEPLGFFFVINQRDELRRELQQQEVYCPVHWHLPEEIDKENFAESYQLSSKALTVPLIGMDEIKFKYLTNCLDKTNLI